MKLPLIVATAIALVPALTFPLARSSSAARVDEAAAATADTALVGTYDCQGVEPDGTPYRGIVQIVANSGAYDVTWIFSSGQQYRGFGVLNGDVLAVSYFTNRPGVAAYKIAPGEEGARLDGQWTVAGAGAVFRETLTRLTAEVKQPERPRQRQEPRRLPAPLLRHLRPA